MKAYFKIPVASALFCALVYCQQACAWPPIFGPEFTFTNAAMLRAIESHTIDAVITEANKQALEDWRVKVEKLCQRRGNCKVEVTKNKRMLAYRVKYDDGFWYQVTTDVGVLEVQTAPNSYDDFKNLKQRMQEDIFDLAKSMGLKPHEITGAGHFNTGLWAAFGRKTFWGERLDAQMFRNYLVDQANHPELYLGILGHDPWNAPTLSDLSDEQQKAFARVIEDFDRRPTTVYELKSRIEKEVYTISPFGFSTPDYSQNERLESVNEKLPMEQQRIETRGVAPQKDMNQHLLQCKLRHERLAWLRGLKGPIPVNIPVLKRAPRVLKLPMLADGTQPTITAEVAVDLTPAELRGRFQNFLKEGQMSEAEFEPLLSHKARTAKPMLFPVSQAILELNARSKVVVKVPRFSCSKVLLGLLGLK